VVAQDAAGTYRVPAPAVQAKDTTGAGDAFTGAFAAALAAGRSTDEALRIGVAYASESVLFPGTQTAFPRAMPEAVR
jgi:ribokinase